MFSIIPLQCFWCTLSLIDREWCRSMRTYSEGLKSGWSTHLLIFPFLYGPCLYVLGHWRVSSILMGFFVLSVQVEPICSLRTFAYFSLWGPCMIFLYSKTRQSNVGWMEFLNFMCKAVGLGFQLPAFHIVPFPIFAVLFRSGFPALIQPALLDTSLFGCLFNNLIKRWAGPIHITIVLILDLGRLGKSERSASISDEFSTCKKSRHRLYAINTLESVIDLLQWRCLAYNHLFWCLSLEGNGWMTW